MGWILECWPVLRHIRPRLHLHHGVGHHVHHHHAGHFVRIIRCAWIAVPAAIGGIGIGGDFLPGGWWAGSPIGVAGEVGIPTSGLIQSLAGAGGSGAGGPGGGGGFASGVGNELARQIQQAINSGPIAGAEITAAQLNTPSLETVGSNELRNTNSEREQHAVPEPATITLMLAALGALSVLVGRRTQ